MSPKQPQKPPSRLECDYDKSPTDLYRAIQRREWESILDTDFDEDDYRTWVVRKEKDGQLRWRLLPLHAAIIFRAPHEVIEDLIANYSQACLQKDDQGMLPLHLALRNEPINFAVLEELLTASPSAVLIKDRKGRTPIQAGLAAAAGNETEAKRSRRHILSALELYGQISGAAVRKQVHTNYQQQLNDKQSQLEQVYQEKLQEISDGFSQKSRLLEEQVAAIQQGHQLTTDSSTPEMQAFLGEQSRLQDRIKALLDEATDLQRQSCARMRQFQPTSYDSLLGNHVTDSKMSLGNGIRSIGRDAPSREEDKYSDAILAVRSDT